MAFLKVLGEFLVNSGRLERFGFENLFDHNDRLTVYFSGLGSFWAAFQEPFRFSTYFVEISGFFQSDFDAPFEAQTLTKLEMDFWLDVEEFLKGNWVFHG